jgi:hypothetical protein
MTMDKTNIARALKIVALLCFLLPWVTVSCAEQELVSMTGLNLALGTAGAANNPMTGQTMQPPGSGTAELPVLIAGLLIIAALVVSFVFPRAKAAMISVGALALAGALAAYSVLVRIPGKVREAAVQESAKDAGGSAADAGPQMTQQILEGIRIESEIGFWLTMAAIVGAIVVTWMGRSEAAPPGPVS